MAFLDFLSQSTIRNAFLSGKCSFVLDRNASVLLWLDGAALSFFGFSSLTDALDREEIFDSAVKRQIENGIKSGHPVHLRGKSGKRSFNLSLISGGYASNETYGENAQEEQNRFIFAAEINSAKTTNEAGKAANDTNRNLSSSHPEALLVGLEGKIFRRLFLTTETKFLRKQKIFSHLAMHSKFFFLLLTGFHPLKH